MTSLTQSCLFSLQNSHSPIFSFSFIFPYLFVTLSLFTFPQLSSHSSFPSCSLTHIFSFIFLFLFLFCFCCSCCLSFLHRHTPSGSHPLPLRCITEMKDGIGTLPTSIKRNQNEVLWITRVFKMLKYVAPCPLPSHETFTRGHRL